MRSADSMKGMKSATLEISTSDHAFHIGQAEFEMCHAAPLICRALRRKKISVMKTVKPSSTIFNSFTSIHVIDGTNYIKVLN